MTAPQPRNATRENAAMTIGLLIIDGGRIVWQRTSSEFAATPEIRSRYLTLEHA